jgi:putative transposase
MGYPSDMSDEEWGVIRPFINDLPGVKLGRPRKVNLRRVLEAIFYVNRTGCQWRYLPKDFLAWFVVYGYFRRWQKDRKWQAINDALRGQLRSNAKRNEGPSAAIVDSQSVKTVQLGKQRGYDAGKKTKGRKRHIAVDTLGLLLVIVIHDASIQPRVGARAVYIRHARHFQTIRTIFVDGGYSGKLIDWVSKYSIGLFR